MIESCISRRLSPCFTWNPTPVLPSARGVRVVTVPTSAPRLVTGSPGASPSGAVSSVLKCAGAHPAIVTAIDSAATSFAATTLSMRRRSRKSGHHLAREEVDTLGAVQVAEDNREKSDSAANAVAQLLENLWWSALDRSAPEGQTLRDLPFLLDLRVIRPDTNEQLLRDIDFVHVATDLCAMLFENVELMLEA